MTLKAHFLATVASVVLCATGAHSASLQVQPALVDVTAPGAASTVTLRNDGPSPIDVQIRVFRWSQENGQEHLVPTDDVVASPPAVTLTPNGDYVARVVRVTKRPVVGEEAYRLLIDELPNTSKAKSGTIKLLVRHSIPAFFTAPDAAPPAIAWSVSRRQGQWVLSAKNKGASRLRISAMTLRDRSGRKLSFGNGLVGYALGGSSMQWAAPASDRRFAPTGSVKITAQGNEGAVNAVAPVVAEK